MKPLNLYIKEKLVIFPSQVNEKLVINKNYNNENIYTPETKADLIKVISDLVIKQKGGTMIFVF